MAHGKDTTPAAPYPEWNDDGVLLCSYRAWTGVRCPDPVGLLYLMTDPWGKTWRALLFTHNAWEERGGVWRETRDARWRRRSGWPAKGRRTPYPAPASEGGPLPGRGPLRYPTKVRCPGCGNRRVLDAEVLDVVPEVDVMRYMAARFRAPDDPAAWPQPGQMPPVDGMLYV